MAKLKGTVAPVGGLVGKLSAPQLVTKLVSGTLNVVEGTFTTGDWTGANDWYFRYDGTGYPVAALFMAEPESESDYYHSTEQNAVLLWAMSKTNKDLRPDYYGTGSAGDLSTIATVHRRQGASQANDYVCNVDTRARKAYCSPYDATPYSPQECIHFRGDAMFSYYVGAGENDYYGLAKNTTYRFIIAYSEEG